MTNTVVTLGENSKINHMREHDNNEDEGKGVA